MYCRYTAPHAGSRRHRCVTAPLYCCCMTWHPVGGCSERPAALGTKMMYRFATFAARTAALMCCLLSIAVATTHQACAYVPPAVCHVSLAQACFTGWHSGRTAETMSALCVDRTGFACAPSAYNRMCLLSITGLRAYACVPARL
jgi:hypothetical protein